jgi:hypothetical protein
LRCRRMKCRKRAEDHQRGADRGSSHRVSLTEALWSVRACCSIEALHHGGHGGH